MPNSKYQIPNKIIFFIFFCLVYLSLLTPLVSFKSLLFPFITSKAFYFRILIELALPFYLYLILSRPNLRPNLKQPLNICLLVFLGLSLLSAIFGVNMERSIWGNLERMGGVYYLLHLTLFYFYALLLGQFGGVYFKRILQGLILIASLVTLNGISGKLGGPALTPDLSLPERVSSTLGNPIFLASFLIVPLCLAGFLYLQAENSKEKYMYAVCALFAALGLYLTGTRGAALGLVAGSAFASLIFLFLLKGRQAKKRAWLVLGSLIAALGLLFIISRFMPPKSTLYRLFNYRDTNTSARLIEWRTALTGFKDHLLLGAGPENYYLVANRYYNPEINKYDSSWFDKPHNFLLEILNTQGVLGLLSYLAVFIAAFVAFWRSFRAELISGGQLSVLTGGLVAYQIQNLFIFDTVSASLAIYLFLGLAAYLNWEAWQEAPNEAKPRGGKVFPPALAPIVFWVSLVLSLYVVYLTNVLPMRLSNNINYGLTLAKKSHYQEAKAYYDRAVALDLEFDKTELFYKYSDMALATAQSQQAVNRDLVQSSLKDAINLGENLVQRQRNLPVAWYYLGALRYFEALVNKSENFDAATEALKTAQSLAPNRPEVYYLTIRLLLAQNELEQALKEAVSYRQKYPQLAESHWQLAWVYYKTGALSQAGQEALLATDRGYQFAGFAEIKLLIDYYQSQKDYNKVVELYEQAIKLESENVQVYIGLARAYKLAGRVDDAKSLAEQIVAADPSQAGNLQDLLK